MSQTLSSSVDERKEGLITRGEREERRKRLTLETDANE